MLYMYIVLHWRRRSKFFRTWALSFRSQFNAINYVQIKSDQIKKQIIPYNHFIYKINLYVM